MSLTVKERGLEAESETTITERTAVRVFTVLDDAGGYVSPIAAENAIGINKYDGHPDDATRVCQSIKPNYFDKQRHDLLYVTVNYSTLNINLSVSPLDDDDKYSIDTIVEEQEYYIDTEGNKCLLTNGKPITPRPKRKVIGYKVVIKRNVAVGFDLTNFATYNNKVNSDSVSYNGVSASAGQVHLILQLSEQQERNGFQYRVLTLNLDIRERGHRQKFDSRDKEELTEDGDLVPIVDDNGREITFAYPLDEDGVALSASTDLPFEIELKPLNEVAMSSFVNG